MCTLLIFACNAAHGAISLHFYGSGNTLVERDTTITINVFAGESTQEQSVDYRLVGLTATAGSDFRTNSGTITFLPGETQKTISIHLIDDATIEELEDFYIELLNPSPEQELSPSTLLFKLADDEAGYAVGYIPYAFENAEYAEVKIRRLGDFNFESTVEAYLVAETARPGIDYVDETFLVTFPPAITERSIRVELLNDKVEDGDRTLLIKLRNPTGGVPLSDNAERPLLIYDNESGYSVVADLRPAFDTIVYEGGTNQLYLWRRGDYDIASTVTVKAMSPDGVRHVAEAGADFTGETFQLEFAPGQSHVLIPVTIINDALAEMPEFISFEHPKSVSDATVRSSGVQIIDNEFNPLPASKVCLGIDPRSGNQLQPGDVAVPVKDGFLIRANSIPFFQQPIQLIRLKHDGTVDSEFQPIDLDFLWFTALRVIETSDGKYLVQHDRTLRRYHHTGVLDSTFQPFTVEGLHSFGEAQGKFYVSVGTNVVRLEPNGTVDESYRVPATGSFQFGIHSMVLQPSGVIYLQGIFDIPDLPAHTNYVRLTASGEFDPSFVPSDLIGNLFGFCDQLYIRSEEHIHRVTAAGQLDPAFHPLKIHYFGEKYHLDTIGNFYIPRDTTRGMVIERYTPDGLPDSTFFRGEIDHPLLRFNVLSLDGTRLLTYGYEQFMSGIINGVNLLCYAPPSGSHHMGLLDLTPAPRPYIPAAIQLLERQTGSPDIIPLTRTGPNSTTTATARYQVRNGTALNGQHFTLPAQGEIHFAQGQSRVELPIVVHDNSVAELSRTFFIDLLDSTGNVTATSEVRILNDDVAVEILGIKNNRLRLSITSAEPYTDFDWTVSSDLQNWESGYITYSGSIVEIDLSSDHRFISGARTPLEYATSPWESPVFSRR